VLTLHRRLSEHQLVEIRISEQIDGDACLDDFLSDEREEVIFPKQVHGGGVLLVRGREQREQMEGDALVTDEQGPWIGVRVADCVPVALYASGLRLPLVAVVHAGWKGIRSGILENTVREMRRLGGDSISAVVGPHISPNCYEFGVEDLNEMIALIGPHVAAVTAEGRPALDLGAGVEAVLRREKVGLDLRLGRCTALDNRYWSHRANGDEERFALLARIGVPT